jgi:hypothetical protein
MEHHFRTNSRSRSSSQKGLTVGRRNGYELK